jgi:hypothetical protein
MNKIRLVVLTCALLLPASVVVSEQDEVPDHEVNRLVMALGYLASGVPELRTRAESIVTEAAPRHFERFESELENLTPEARLGLFRILAATPHGRRVPMCIELMCNPAATRAERVAAVGALRTASADALVKVLEEHLGAAAPGTYEHFQLTMLLGLAPTSRAQTLAESILRDAEPGSLLAFAAEDAALRSILHTAYAQPAWNRYRQRNPGTPDMTLRELQDMLDDLALPTAMERFHAEAALVEVLGDDERMLLALSRSHLPERAHFALARLRQEPVSRHVLPSQVVLLDLVTTGTRTAALLTLDVAIAGRPPAEEDLDKLRPYVNINAMMRLELIVEALFRVGDLAALRHRRNRLHSQLRTLMVRRGALDRQVREHQATLAQLEAQLERLEVLWAEGWRREFRPEILNTRGA